MSKLLKRMTATVLAMACVGTMSATASAETIFTPPVNWIAVYQKGAPTSVNRTYYYPVYTYGDGYDITCTFFLGDYDREVKAKMQYNTNILGAVMPVEEDVATLHAETFSPIYVENPSIISSNSITFSFATNCSNNCNANGVISYHK